MEISTKKNKLSIFLLCSILSLSLSSCLENDEPAPPLEIPDTYQSTNYDANVTAERQVRDQLQSLIDAMNAAEANAINGTNTNAIIYPAALKAVTQLAYATRVEEWLTELVAAANSGTPFDLANAPSGQG
ncbi:MAG: DUF4202 domain-containing protein, partial [Bacteroidia bacterium]|nr:DUF4202 domain-containing protein [Bacteroidia bacterium]